MENVWDVTITKMGAIKIIAESEEAAIEKAEHMDISTMIQWEDSWNAVDVCIATTQ